jgi:hypothetical protein
LGLHVPQIAFGVVHASKEAVVVILARLRRGKLGLLATSTLTVPFPATHVLLGLERFWFLTQPQSNDLNYFLLLDLVAGRALCLERFCAL